MNWSSDGLHHLILAREGLRNYKEEPPAATQVLSCTCAAKILMCVLLLKIIKALLPLMFWF